VEQVADQSRSLGDDGGVDILDRTPFGSGPANDLTEKLAAFHAGEPVVCVWKEPTEIAFTQGPENGIAEGMDQHIGIGVADQAFLKGHVDTAQHEFPSLPERMDIIA